MAPTDGERTNNKKKKEEFVIKAEKDQSLQSLLKDVKGVREQAETHRVIYTPLGQKYDQGDPDLSRGYRSPRNQGSPPCVSKEQAEQPLCTLHQTGSEDGRQEVSSPSQMRGLEGPTVACFFSAGSVSFILYCETPRSCMPCVTHQAPQVPENSRDCVVCQVLRDQEYGLCSVSSG